MCVRGSDDGSHFTVSYEGYIERLKGDKSEKKPIISILLFLLYGKLNINLCFRQMFYRKNYILVKVKNIKDLKESYSES